MSDATGAFVLTGAPHEDGQLLISAELQGRLALVRVPLAASGEAVTVKLPRLHEVLLPLQDRQGRPAPGVAFVLDASGPLHYQVIDDTVQARAFELGAAPLRLLLARGDYVLQHLPTRTSGANQLSSFEFQVGESASGRVFVVRR